MANSILSAKTRKTIINLNGQIIPMDQANVSVFDRSFLYGDSLYEVIRTYQGKAFRLKDHLARLQHSGSLCHFQCSQSMEEYEREVLRTISAFRAQKGLENEDVYVRLIVSRGAGKIGFGLGSIETPTLYVIIAEPISMYPNKPFEAGMSLQISKRMRNHPEALDPAIKSGNYLNNLLAYLSAADAGYDDALMLDYQGFVTEGTVFNVYYVKRGIVATPPLDVGILDGITRRVIVNLCVQLGIPCRETRFPKEYLYEADEVFISGSVKELVPVTHIDGKKIGTGKGGPVCRQLISAFRDHIKTELSLS